MNPPTEQIESVLQPHQMVYPYRKRATQTINTSTINNKQQTSPEEDIVPPLLMNFIPPPCPVDNITNPSLAALKHHQKEIVIGEGDCSCTMDKEGTTYTVRTVDKHERSLNSSHDNATSITRSSIPPQTTATTQPQIHSSTTTSPTISPTFATLYRSASSYRAHVSGTPQYVQTSPAQVVRSSSFDSNLPIFSHIPSTNITHANTLSSPSLSPNHAYFLSSTPTQFLSTSSIPTIQYSSSPNYCPIPNTTFSHVPLFVSTQPVTVVPSNIQKPNISKKKVKTPSSPVASSSSSSSQSSQHLQIVSQEHPSAQERKRSISPAFGEQVKLTPPEKKTKTIEIPKSTQALKIPRAEIAEAKQHSKDSLKGKKTIVARFLCPNNCEIQGTPIVSLDSSSHSVIIQGVSLVYNPPEFAQLDKTVVVKGENGSLEVRLPLLE